MATFRMPRAVLLAAALLPAAPAAAQETPPPARAAVDTTRAPVPPLTARNAFYLEVGGNGILYSINYDRRLTPELGFRVGLMALPVWFPFDFDEDDADGGVVVLNPVTANALLGRGNHHLELGVGVTFTNAAIDIGDLEESGSGVLGTGTVGYRYQRPGGGIVFRAGLTPLFLPDDAGGAIVLAGISVGRAQ